MNKNTKFWIITIAIVIIGSNLLPFTYFFPRSFKYQNLEGSFHYIEHPDKGLDFEVGEIRYNRFLKNHPNIKDKQLYRTFGLESWRFWEWFQMISNFERFRLPTLPSKS